MSNRAQPKDLACSVIVPVYNAADMLEQCLRHLCDQTLDSSDYEVIVIDDGSTDHSADVARRFPVRLIELGSNQGRIVARSRGAEAARSDLLIFCDVRVFVERDALETALDIPEKPLMFGCDDPEMFDQSLMGRFLFGVYRRIWKGYFPQEWLDGDTVITEDNFETTPKGTTLLATPKDLWLRHQPEQRDRYVNDDTLIFRSMVRETPIIRTARIRCHYQQRTDLAEVIPHLHWRGARFGSYYIRPGHRYFWVYLAIWVAMLVVVGTTVARPESWWLLPVVALAGWVGFAAYLSYSVKSFFSILAILPAICISFGTGILRGHVADLRRAMVGDNTRGLGGWIRTLVPYMFLAAISALTVWYVRAHWHEFREIPSLPWWSWGVVGLLVLSVHTSNAYLTARMCDSLGFRLPKWQWLPLALGGALGNLLGPMRAGMFLRGVYMKRRGLDYSLFLSTLAGTYVLSTLAQMLISAAGLILLAMSGRGMHWPLLGLVSAVGVGTLGVAALRPRPPAWLERIAPPVARGLEGWRSLLKRGRHLGEVMGCFLLNVLCMAGILWFVFRMLGSPIPAGSAMAMAGLGGLATLLAITPGALGVFDFTAVVTGTALGADPQTSVMAVLTFRAADMTLVVVGGSISAWLLLGVGPVNTVDGQLPDGDET